MKFSVEWEEGAQASSDIDLRARGGLSILVDGRNTCAFHAAGEHDRAVSNCLFVSAYPPAARSVVNDLREASRQACGRAFAAEFLAPIEEIASMRADGRDTDAIADEFGVSSWLVERQEENAGRIRQACA